METLQRNILNNTGILSHFCRSFELHHQAAGIATALCRASCLFFFYSLRFFISDVIFGFQMSRKIASRLDAKECASSFVCAYKLLRKTFGISQQISLRVFFLSIFLRADRTVDGFVVYVCFLLFVRSYIRRHSIRQILENENINKLFFIAFLLLQSELNLTLIRC